MIDRYKFKSYTPAIMANTKSAIKRIRRISKQTAVNKIRKSRYKNAIKNKGSSLKDYSSIHGTLGNYQNKFLVYNDLYYDSS